MKLGAVLKLKKGNLIDIEDDKEYTIAGVQSYGQGIINRRTTSGKELTMKKYQVIQSNQLMWCKVDTKNGAFGVTTKEQEGSLASTNMALANIDIQKANPEFIQLLFRIPFFYQYINDLSTGTTNRKYLKQNDVLDLINIPNMNLEQQNEFMNWYKEFEIEYLKLIEENTKQREMIIKLRQSILQEAIQGKLVPQDLNDEPASVLLEKIKEEKEQLIKEKKIKKEKSLLPIAEDEIPYELPEGWEWVRLGTISQINPRNNIDDELEVSFIPMKLIEDGFNNKHTFEIEKWGKIKSGFTHFQENDVVMAKITPCFQNRKSAVMKNLINGYGAGTTELYVIRSYANSIVPEYLLSMFKTEDFIRGGVETYTGTAGQQRVKKEYVENYIFPLAPLSEQKRIAEKVNQLMAFCDELEKNIEKSKKDSELLMQSVLQEAFKESDNEAGE